MRIPAIVLLFCGAAISNPIPISGECEACKALPRTKDLGECSLCGGMTTSGSYRICLECSGKRGECQRCRKPLAPAPAEKVEKIDESRDGTYSSGPWEFRFEISAMGTRSEGHHGRLFHGGGQVPVPGGINDHYRTPWGPLYWVGRPVTPFGWHGWMPRPLPSRPAGRLLDEPKPAAPTVRETVRPGPMPGTQERWLEIGADSDGRTIEVRGAHGVAMSLSDDGPPWFSWSVKSISGGAVRAETPPPRDPAMAPKTETRTFEVEFRAVEKGKAEVTLEYSIPGTADPSPERTIRVMLDVQEVPASAKPDR